MSSVLIAVLGFGERPPDVGHLISLCAHPCTSAMLVTWHCPGPETATALEFLARGSPKVHVESTSENMGSAGGYSRLLARASGHSEWDYLLLLDDDLEVEPGAIAKLAAIADHDGMATPTLYLAHRPGLAELAALVDDGEQLRDIRPGACVGFHFLNFTHAGGRQSSRSGSGVITVDAAPYGGLFVPRSCLASLGAPDSQLFLYADDAEWTLRFTRAGGRIRLVPDARIKDRSPSWNATTSAGGNLARRILHLGDTKAYYEARNRNFLARTHFSGSTLVYRTNKLVFLVATYVLAAMNRKLVRASLIHRAVNDGEAMAGNPASAWPSPPPGLDGAGPAPHQIGDGEH